VGSIDIEINRFLETPDGKETVVAEQQWIQHSWTSIEADLTPWAGQRVRIKLMGDVGPEDNSSGDWACWAKMRVESLDPVLVLSVHDQPVQLQFEAPPLPQPDLTVQQLREAKSGRLHFQGIGLQCGGQYISQAKLNGVSLGDLPAAGGNESQGIWSDAAVTLSPAAIATLAESNRFQIDNPGQDCFKVRRVWLELESADGRQCASKVTTACFTQPPDWLYQEGTGVPFSEEMTIEIRFDLKSAE